MAMTGEDLKSAAEAEGDVFASEEKHPETEVVSVHTKNGRTYWAVGDVLHRKGGLKMGVLCQKKLGEKWVDQTA